MRQEAGGSSPTAPPPPPPPPYLPSLLASILPGWRLRRRIFSDFPLCTSSTSFSYSSSLVLLLLLFEQLVDLPLGHGRVLADDAVLVQAGQQQQETHCRSKVKVTYLPLCIHWLNNVPVWFWNVNVQPSLKLICDITKGFMLPTCRLWSPRRATNTRKGPN